MVCDSTYEYNMDISKSKYQSIVLQFISFVDTTNCNINFALKQSMLCFVATIY